MKDVHINTSCLFIMGNISGFKPVCLNLCKQASSFIAYASLTLLKAKIINSSSLIMHHLCHLLLIRMIIFMSQKTEIRLWTPTAFLLPSKRLMFLFICGQIVRRLDGSLSWFIGHLPTGLVDVTPRTAAPFKLAKWRQTWCWYLDVWRYNLAR